MDGDSEDPDEQEIVTEGHVTNKRVNQNSIKVKTHWSWPCSRLLFFPWDRRP